MASVTTILEEARLAGQALLEYAGGLINPTVRLGVTGLTHAGKTVFITALVHNLLARGRLPVFEAYNSGRIASARLEPQPDDAVPRFDYEGHIRSLTVERQWPESTRRISELRLAIDYQSARGRARTLTLDIVDYPGEWLLDLPLLSKTYAEWSADTLRLSQEPPRSTLAAEWHAHLATLKAEAPENEQDALQAARLFTEYLKACRDDRYAMSLLPPGRFLMPGDLAGSPALTFAPLELPHEGTAPAGSLWAMMERRYESYRNIVVRPFFRDHFARLDRQIVLVDALAALNAGPAALRDLEDALTAILDCFRAGRRSFVSSIFRPRIDRILFAATKADHLHHINHDRLERILERMVGKAVARAEFAGAKVDVVALAAVRSTREAMVSRGRDVLPSIVGYPVTGETADAETFDGMTEAAMFPGDLPEDAEAPFAAEGTVFTGRGGGASYRFLRFRPGASIPGAGGAPALPHIRLDRTLQFVLGDYLA
jgi:uncharacterized protein